MQSMRSRPHLNRFFSAWWMGGQSKLNPRYLLVLFPNWFPDPQVRQCYIRHTWMIMGQARKVFHACMGVQVSLLALQTISNGRLQRVKPLQLNLIRGFLLASL